MNILKDTFKSNEQNGATRQGGISTDFLTLPTCFAHALLLLCSSTELL